MLRKDHDAGCELELGRQRRRVGERDQRIGNRRIVTAAHLAVLGSRVRRMRQRHDDMLDRPDRFEAQIFGVARELREKFGMRELLPIGKHESRFHFFTVRCAYNLAITSLAICSRPGTSFSASNPGGATITRDMPISWKPLIASTLARPMHESSISSGLRPAFFASSRIIPKSSLSFATSPSAGKNPSPRRPARRAAAGEWPPI